MENWPIVLERDYGIRPAGPQDECFYCQQKVGQKHKKECVTIEKMVKYNVLVEGSIVGTFTRLDPHHWTEEDCNFHKNLGTWCASNALKEIVWNDEEQGRQIILKVEKEYDECACDLLDFEFVEVTDPGPIQHEPHPKL